MNPHFILLLLLGTLLVCPCNSFSPTLRPQCRSYYCLSSSRLDDLDSFPSDPYREMGPRALKWNVLNLFRDDPLGTRHLEEIYKAASDVLSASSSSTPCEANPRENSELEKARRFLSAYSSDRNHDGRFGVDDEQYSLQANLVFSMDEPLSYIRDVLSSPSSSKKNKEEEVVVFCPGLHTPLSQSTRQRNYLSQVLEGMPLSILQVGCHDPQEDFVDVPLTADTVLALRTLDLMVETDESPIQGALYRLHARDLDLLRAAVAWKQPDQCKDQLVETILKLVDVAVESARTNSTQPSVVLVTYSATARAVSAALSQWKQLAILPNHRLRNRELDPDMAETLLRNAVTVVTIGSLCPTFPDGPAYIHLSMYDDKLVAECGPHPQSGSAGKDAVFLQALSPYDSTARDCYTLANDAHNPQASGIQFLALVWRRNGMRSFRHLYQAGSKPTPQLDICPTLFAIQNYYSNKVGELDLPSDDLLVAMIRATGGDRWLENELQDDDILPEWIEAEATIAEHFGYGVYEEIVEACCDDDDEDEEEDDN